MFAIGDIVSIYAPTVGYKKYHLCVHVGTDGTAHQFLFLNSDDRFEGVYSVECERVPCVPRSASGRTAFSFTMLPRYNDKQLKLYGAKKLGVIDPVLATELLEFAEKAVGLTKAEQKIVCAALKSIAKKI
jgi:hypothetical protein